MRVSAKAEYACIAMLELAASYAETQPVRVKDIADAHGIPHTVPRPVKRGKRTQKSCKEQTP